MWATSQFAGAVFGPVVTGLLLEHFWRGSAAASLSETANALGGTLGIALLGTVVAAVYQRGMAQMTSGTTGQTLAAAVASHDPALVSTARTAYTEGLSVAGVLCALVFAGLAFLVTHSFRETSAQPPQRGGKPFSATNRPLGDR